MQNDAISGVARGVPLGARAGPGNAAGFAMSKSAIYNPDDDFLGGFTSTDGTVEFFSRVNALLTTGSTVLDLGAGRGAWLYEDRCEYRKSLRTIKGKVREYICADIDEAVLSNPTGDRNVLIKDSRIPLEDASVDIVICDYVLEHVLEVGRLKGEISRVLRSGGYFCARTPHRLNYVSFFARIIGNAHHARVLAAVQPDRRPVDIFPTVFRLNSPRQIRRAFPGWDNFSYVYSSEPRYYFGVRSVYRLLRFFHDHAWDPLTGNMFIFLRKP